MKIRKYNYQARSYSAHEIPDSWKIKTSEDGYAETINCAGCGKPLKHIKSGDAFTSMRLLSTNGLGYTICESCHAREFEEAKKADEKRRNNVCD